jgi:alpha-beta hydrolase superfamily lysophospholipase
VAERVQASESGVPDLRPDAAKTVAWADPDRREATPLAVVYLHGFSASRVETAPLADSVAAALGANLFYTRLTGHGRDGPAMADASVEAWLDDADEALRAGAALGERVVLVGSSTGGTLALWAAVASPWRDRLAALVLLSPNLGPADARSRILLWPWGGLLARVVVGPTRSFTPVNEAQARGWTTSYPTRALLPMMALVDAVDEELLERVRAPTLLLHSPHDRVLDVEAMLQGYEALGSAVKRRVAVEEVGDPYHHILAGDILSPSTTLPVARHIVRFIDEVR